jgi:uncharacterized membrane protein YbhN (UPF0104 family)
VKGPKATSGSTVSWSVKPQYVVLLILGFIGIYFALPQIGALKDALTVIRHSNWGWILAALALTGLTFPAGTFTQFIAGGKLGSVRELGLRQLAGAFLSHFIPFSLGTIGVTSRYYQKLGKKPVQATTAATLPTIFGIATTVLMVAFISPPTIKHLTQRFQADSHKHWLIVIVGLTLLLSLLATNWIRRNVINSLRE